MNVQTGDFYKHSKTLLGAVLLLDKKFRVDFKYENRCSGSLKKPD